MFQCRILFLPQYDVQNVTSNLHRSIIVSVTTYNARAENRIPVIILVEFVAAGILKTYFEFSKIINVSYFSFHCLHFFFLIENYIIEKYLAS